MLSRFRLVSRTLLGLSLAALLVPVSAFAQFDTATVVGTVRDTSKAVVPGAKVTLTAVDTGISVVKTSGSDGNYEFPAVKPGQKVSKKRAPAPLQALGFTLDELKEARLAPVVDFKGRKPKAVGES